MRNTGKTTSWYLDHGRRGALLLGLALAGALAGAPVALADAPAAEAAESGPLQEITVTALSLIHI